jgi:hypothetical protein
MSNNINNEKMSNNISNEKLSNNISNNNLNNLNNENKIIELNKIIENQKELINKLKRKYENTTKENVKSKKIELEKIEIQFKNKEGDIDIFKILKTTIFKKLFTLYIERKKLPKNTTFTYRGLNIDENKTVEDYDSTKKIFEIEVEYDSNIIQNNNNNYPTTLNQIEYFLYF